MKAFNNKYKLETWKIFESTETLYFRLTKKVLWFWVPLNYVNVSNSNTFFVRNVIKIIEANSIDYESFIRNIKPASYSVHNNPINVTYFDCAETFEILHSEFLV